MDKAAGRIEAVAFSKKERKSMVNENNKDMITPESVRRMIKTTVSKMGPNFTVEQKKEHAKLLVKIFEKGMSPKEAMQVSDLEMSQIYSFAYSKFNAGQYAEACELFKLLLVLEPLEGGFATSLGVCHHRLGRYQYALPAYMLAAALNPTDPVPLFYAYHCFLNLEEKASACIMLCNVISRAGDQPKYATIKERAKLILETLEKELVQQPAPAKSS